MKSTNSLWKTNLHGQTAPDLERELDIYETELELRRQGKLDEKVFAETRLRRGAYGQRYDNGQRWDGEKTQQLAFPSELTKGPGTAWDAPGMVRVKIPFGGMNAHQLEVMAELAEEYSDNIAHVTTRQDFQLHFVHIEDTPALMRRLAAVGITTREACGNSVRNVTACPIAGVCHTEAFDVTPYAHGLAMFLLGHPDTQDFGRKFKIAFSGCVDKACGLVMLHDMGAIAKVQVVDGEEKRGFALYVGGGLGSVPHQAKLFAEFLPEEELLPISQAISRVYAKLGEKKNRNRARIKFLIAQLGIDEFRRLVLEERKILPFDPRWSEFLHDLHGLDEEPLHPAGALPAGEFPTGFAEWHRTNAYAQKQAGYATVTIKLPLGDITPDQLRGLADLARSYTRETIRLTVDQNIVLRWVSQADLVAFYLGLQALQLAQAGAGTLIDITSCPGTDTCKLGISASRGLASELSQRLAAKAHLLDEAIQGLHIKVSGCFNSCGQHHVADLGFYGVSRRSGNYTVPHFQVVLGGQWHENAGAYGLAIVAVPSKNIPAVVDRLTSAYITEREKAESFQAYIKRVGKAQIKASLEDLTKIPAHDDNPSFYSDWGDTREFTLGDIGEGECAGEVVSRIEFDLAFAEREAFEAQILLEKGDFQLAGERAYGAMLQSARALVREQLYDVPSDPEQLVNEFRTRYYDTQLFWDPFAGGKFGQYLFHAHKQAHLPYSPDEAHRRIEEAQLVVEAAHACYQRLSKK